MEEAYRQILMDHFRSPRNRELPGKITHQGNCFNRSCGDFVDCRLNLDDDVIKDVAIIASGCTMCVATSSFVSEIIRDQKVNQIVKWRQEMRNELSKPLEEAWDLEELKAFQPLRKNPSRHSCCLMVWEALIQAIGPDTNNNH